MTAREVNGAYLANVVSDAHRDDSEFGQRLLTDGDARAGLRALNGGVADLAKNWWRSVFGEERTGNGRKVGPPPTTTSSCAASVPIDRQPS